MATIRTAATVRTTWLCAGLLFATLPTTAVAEPLQGRFGLGADTALGLSSENSAFGQRPTLPGFAATYFLSDALGLQFIVSFQRDSGDLSGEDITVTTLGVAARALWGLIRTRKAHLSLIGGLSYALVDESSDDPDRSDTRLGLEVALRPEWFITDYFSLHTQAGLLFSMWTRDPGEALDREGTEIAVFGNANLVGNAGFTFWF